MKKRGKLSRLALALLVGVPALARAQVPAVPPLPPAAPLVAVPTTGVTAVPPTGTAAAPQKNLWSFLCPNDAQKAKLKACLCGSQFGQLLNNSMAPLSALTGGVLPQFCPALDPADLLLPPDSAQGAAAQVKKDTLAAAQRRAAIRYISTADCNWWPEVQAALANSLRMDRNECVRLEAALALQRGCCCNPTTVKALTQALSPSPTDTNPPEDSPRVRAAAMAALDHCLHCYFAVTPAPPAPPPAVEQLPVPRKEGPPPELPPSPPPPPPPGKVPVVRAEPPLRPVSATGPVRDARMDQLVQEARLVLQKAKERQQVAIRAAAVRPHSLTELLEETFHPSATQASPLAAGQQQTTPPPTIFGSPARTPVMEKPVPAPTAGVTGAPAVIAFDDDGIAEPAPAPTAGAAGAPRPFVAPPAAPQENPSLAPVAVNPALPALTPTSVAPFPPSVVPSSVAPTLPVSASPVPIRPPTLTQGVSTARAQPEKAPVLMQQTAEPPATRQTLSDGQLLLLLRNSTYDDVRVHAANSLANHEKPMPSVVQALVSGAGSDASSEVRLACLKTLWKLRVNDPALPPTLMRLQMDRDSRVREAARALHQQLQSRADAPTPPRS